MTWQPWKFFEAEWSITATGVITVSESPHAAGSRQQMFHCHGLAVGCEIHDTLHCGPAGQIILTGGIVVFEVADIKGNSHSLILSKDNLLLNKFGSTPMSSFTSAICEKHDTLGDMPELDEFFGRGLFACVIIHTNPCFVF